MTTTNGTGNGRPTPAAGDQWQSIDQLAESPEFLQMMKDEFPEDAPEWLDPVGRRKFLTLMGASLSLAGVVGCNPSFKPASAKKAIPYVKKPDALIPGVPMFFATAFPHAGYGLGVLVKSQEGRPLKVEGNPTHPASLGATDMFAQASVLQLHDPDRSRDVTNRGVPATWEKAKGVLAKLVEAQKPKKGAGFRVLTGATSSQTFANLMGELKALLPEMKWVTYEPVNQGAAAAGAGLAFKRPVEAVYKLDAADVIVSLDGDFFANGPGGVRYSRDAMSRRKMRVGTPGDGMAVDKLSRIYAVESAWTGVGAVADHRLPLKPSEVEAFCFLLAKELGVPGVAAVEASSAAATAWVKPVAADLKAAAGKGVVVPGDCLSAAAHAVCHAINAVVGKDVVSYIAPVLTGEGYGESYAAAGLKALTDEMLADKVDTLFVFGTNPVYTAPADVEFATALEKVKTKVHLGLYADETAALCDWHINETHYLETWGDVRAYDGTATIQQPLIAPVHNGKSAIELVAVLLDKSPLDTQLLVRATWEKWFADTKKAGEFDTVWHGWVERGVVDGTTFPAIKDLPTATAAGVARMLKTKPNEIEVAFRPDPTVYDGRYANLGWLQELPKAITKLTWDNAAIVSPGTAARLGITNDFGWTGGEHGRTEANMVEVKVNGRSVKMAGFILPGHPDDVILLHLGYGRPRAGRVGTGVGFNTYAVRATTGMWSAAGAKAPATREKYLLACTQGQHAMEGRRPSRWGTVETVKAELKEAKEAKHHKFAFEFADNPPVAMAEKGLMRALLPGTPEERDRLAEKEWLPFNSHGHKKGDGHAHAEEHNEGGHHDKRLTPLTLIEDIKVHKQYRRWGMAFDLGMCTGCGACVAACVAENNIPVVGKDQVTRGRAMHWIRVDRYFAATVPVDGGKDEKGGVQRVNPVERAEALREKNVQVTAHFQPVNCQQCEKAPCEVVCPVGATVHSADGLNDMAYNRCVGTRYCSNNCPYKVRRFNFIQYADYAADTTLKLVNNPEVTVRTRGVMEKCTYCVQRIRNAEIEAEREHDNPKRPKAIMPDGTTRPVILEGEIVTACQSACPAKAIAFGDLNYDQYTVNGKRLPASEVTRWKQEPTNYGLLAELNTMPRTSYLAAVKNPNPNMPKGA